MRNFSQAPFLVIWETTQACDLACRHCRASAVPDRHAEELSTAEARRMLDQVKAFGDPLLVFTGGDPLKRADLFGLLRYAVNLGLRTAVTPSATPLLTGDAVMRFRDCGVSRMAVSLDGPDAAAHDGFRGVAGSFDRTLEALRAARRAGLETQVNTTVSRFSMDRLQPIAQVVEDEGAKLWSLFFLVVTGRARLEDDLTAEEYEQVFEFLFETSLRAPFQIKTTEAQHYRRYVAQRRKSARGLPPVNDGKGFLFVSHTGEIFPSGFLELSAGNVRRTALAEAYRGSALFQALRNPDAFQGKCGACEYRNLCGGSRARAYALTGDYAGSDPRCVYEPPTLVKSRPTQAA
jgi:radical SAM protein with 4Fe4S-binding SPASM domain